MPKKKNDNAAGQSDCSLCNKLFQMVDDVSLEPEEDEE